MRIAAALALLAATASAAPVQFDQGFSIPALLTQMKAAPAMGAAAPASSAAAADKAIVRWMAGWHKATVKPGQTVYGPFEITATAIEEHCTVDHRGGMQCRETFGMTKREKVRLVFKDRPAVSRDEVFDITLDWHLYVQMQVVEGRGYNWKRVGDDLVMTAKP